jgi:CBS domain-containing protein
MVVRKLMTTDVVTVDVTTPLKHAALLLAERRISGVPVVDRDGAVVGVLSEADVLVQERGGPRGPGGLLGLLLDPDALWREKAGARLVGDAMTAPAICIGPARPAHEAAARMLDARVNRLPVVEDGKLVGILTRADLVRAFVRDDEELEREIRDEVFGRALWLDPNQLEVDVRRGVANVFGSLDCDADERAMASLVGRVPGVVSVVSHVRVGERNGTDAPAR